MLHVRRWNAFTSLPFGGKFSPFYQCWSVSPVLNALYLTCPAPHVISLFHCPHFVVSLPTSSLELPLLSCGYFLNISSAARGLCCLRRSVDIFPGPSLDQPSCLLFASKSSNSEAAGPRQNAWPSSSAVGSSKRVTISFSRYYLVARPFTGLINCLQSWRRHRSSSSSWHPRRRSVASSREVERRRTGQIRLAYQLPMCAAVHLHPSLPQNNSRIVWEQEAFD